MSESMSRTILIVDDDRAIRDGLTRAISGAGFAVRACEGVGAARRALAEAEVDCVLLDIRLKDGDGLDLLAELRKTHPRLPVVMATAYGDSDRTIQAMKLGAFDYVTKPFDLDALLATIARASRSTEAAKSVVTVEPASESALVGSSARMLEVWKAIGRAASSDVPVLVTGESGVGKELVARAIHENSERRAEPFVAVNIAALPATLVESELFGHEKGAFTGANARREGRFEAASRGTLFLDEIGDLELPLQTKLLRVLQDGTFERVGSQTPLVSHARVIAATSREVLPKAKGTTLREDLFYRLGVVRIEVPPLRERSSDIPLLVEAFLRRQGSKAGRRAVSEAAMRRLAAHTWPGNVRELLHVLERACVMTTAEVIDEGDLDLGIDPTTTGREAKGDDGGGDLHLHRAVEALERSLIERALKRSGGNRAEAARLLGIARPQLYTKMKDLGLELPDASRPPRKPGEG
jgi:DNA-binding NtrC family response regulator